MKQPGCRRGYQLSANTDAAGRLPEDGDIVRVTTEGADIFAHPAQGSGLVHDAVITRTGVGRIFRSKPLVCHKAEDAQAVIDGDHDHILAPGQTHAVVLEVTALAHDEAAAVNPHHDWHGFLRLVGRGPHVEVQAVL